MNTYSNPYIQEIDKESITNNDKQARLIVYNDDINTFDYVEQCLMNICHHTPEQAQQCSHLIHWRGSCCVKQGEYSIMQDMAEKLKRCGLRASVR
ncbi:MAG: ATP-dependent Clp protease adaptor ClpS [Bacteroidia bacterium]|nr:ATP-dependent Clp protease adaptor ClpS [Bacteroidia bacterium]MDW8348248.1 ATP-dependent Clp protease adaptor ClpS [Bacteroidia bacterium]